MIAIIDITGNNLTSLVNALKKLHIASVLTHDKAVIKKASQVILPGVGAAKPAMAALKKFDLIGLLQDYQKPLVGICLGMQLLYEGSEEGNIAGLGLIPGYIKKLTQKKGYPIPHMGWSKIAWNPSSDKHLRAHLQDDDYFYFVHSFAALEENYQLASCRHGEKFAAIVQKNNILGIQFHPEKSATKGLQLLKNIFSLEDSCSLSLPLI